MDSVRLAIDDEYRKRQEVVTAGLQTQIEDLRRQVKEALGKSIVVEDAHKNALAKISELSSSMEQMRQERAQADQARSLEDQRNRRALVELNERIEQPLQILRQLQSQFQDLSDQVRKDKEQYLAGLEQIEALKQRLAAVFPRLALIEDAQSQVKESIADILEKVQEDKKTINRVLEHWQLDVQRLQRRDNELADKFDEQARDKAEVWSKLQWVDEQRKNDKSEAEKLQARIDFLEINRDQNSMYIQRLSDQISNVNMSLHDQVEQYRTKYEVELSELSGNIQVKFDKLILAMEGWEEHLHRLEGRLGLIPGRFDELRQRDKELLDSIAIVEEQRIIRRMDQLQRELDELRKRRDNKDL